jgi:pilus assembly protein CpaB
MRFPKLSSIRYNKTWLVLGVALAIGVLAALSARTYLANRMAEIDARAKGKTINVVVAKKELKAGDRVSEDTVAIRPVPVDYAHSQAILPENFERVAGQALAYPLKSGEMVLWGLLEGKKAATFSTRVAEGHRAITVPVDEISSISGLLEPGDLVDLVLTIDLHGRKYSFVFQQKVPVLATGQRSTDDPKSGERRQYTTVTFDTTPDQAQNIIRARESGKLTALLRNPQDSANLAGTDTSSLFSKDSAGELAQVPVLYGGAGAKLPPEGLRLGHYVRPDDRDKPSQTAFMGEGPAGVQGPSANQPVILTSPRSK